VPIVDQTTPDPQKMVPEQPPATSPVSQVYLMNIESASCFGN
jgi:hypothetical protein